MIGPLAAWAELNFCGGATILEPFAGGAAVSLWALDWGFAPAATLVERDPLLYAFWECATHRPYELIQALAFLEPTEAARGTVQDLTTLDAPDEARLLDMAAAALLLNRTSFAGILGAGPIGGRGRGGPIRERWNPEALSRRIAYVGRFGTRIQVAFGDGTTYLREHAQDIEDGFMWAFVDPPYLDVGDRLYRYGMGLEGHETLAAHLREARYPWVLTHVDDPRIRALYEGFPAATHAALYTAAFTKPAPEILVSNYAWPTRAQNPAEQGRAP